MCNISARKNIDMHPRYIKKDIQKIWLSSSIYAKWQEVELTVLEVRKELNQISPGHYASIVNLLQTPIDEKWLEEKEKELRHDLNAFLDERRRFLPPDFQHVFHEGMTSYDTEEPARSMMLQESAKVILNLGNEVLVELLGLAKKYRYTPMLGVTHGQWAGIMSFGVRCAKWYMGLWKMLQGLKEAMEYTNVAKLSGAIGTYSEVITMEVEVKVMEKLGLRPFFGATQIVPRYVWIPLAQAVLNVVEVIGNIAETLRLGARSGYQITQELFGQKQKGSSAMPHKRNPITWEKVIGMVQLARGYVVTLQSVCTTWEERDIRESALERNAWPDLFHAAAHALTCMKKTLVGLVVNKEVMLRQIKDSRGTYATDLAKGWLAEKLASKGVIEPADTAYRILQVASFQVFTPKKAILDIVSQEPTSLKEVNRQYSSYSIQDPGAAQSIEGVIQHALLPKNEHFEEKTINSLLYNLFINEVNCKNEWNKFFKLDTYLAKEDLIFEVLDTMSQLP